MDTVHCAASWYYRAVLTALLGIHMEGTRMTLSPCLPTLWPGFRAEISWLGTQLSIEVRRGSPALLLCDGEPVREIPLDKSSHQVILTVDY